MLEYIYKCNTDCQFESVEVSPNIYCLFPYQSLVGLVQVMPSHTSVIEGLAEINSLVASPEQTGWSPAYLSTLSTKEENISLYYLHLLRAQLNSAGLHNLMIVIFTCLTDAVSFLHNFRLCQC